MQVNSVLGGQEYLILMLDGMGHLVLTLCLAVAAIMKDASNQIPDQDRVNFGG
jgi:hypothetical protein